MSPEVGTPWRPRVQMIPPVFFLVVLAFVAGCGTTRRPEYDAELLVPALAAVQESSATTSSDGAVRGRPGFVVNVSVLIAGKTEIVEKAKRISESGTITLPLLGTVHIEDQTLDEMQAMLQKRYADYFVQPQVIVDFARDDSDGTSPWGYVTVLGRVKKPGRISMPATRDLTVSGAIQQAGGFDTSARDTAIRITRRHPDGTVEVQEVNFRSVGAKGQLEQDVRLEPEDVVFVPEMIL